MDGQAEPDPAGLADVEAWKLPASVIRSFRLLQDPCNNTKEGGGEEAIAHIFSLCFFYVFGLCLPLLDCCSCWLTSGLSYPDAKLISAF